MGVSNAGGRFDLGPSERARLAGRYWPKAKPRAAAPQDAELAHNCAGMVSQAQKPRRHSQIATV